MKKETESTAMTKIELAEITSDTEFAIGLDFGHGETAASLCDLKDGAVKNIDILPGLSTIKSAVAVMRQESEETVCVGESAINNSANAKKFQISFKKRPSQMSEEERSLMVRFMRGVYAEILAQHPDYRMRNHVVYIARPSQDRLWLAEEQAYLAMACEAGLPVAGIHRESRAAYFRARTQPGSKIDEYVRIGVLICDFGSSTVDLTYLNESLTEPIDDGFGLGASEVERLLMQYALKNSDNPYMQEFYRRYGDKPDSNPYNMMLYEFRKCKEEYYANKKVQFMLMLDIHNFTQSEEDPMCGAMARVEISRNKINEILGKGVDNGYIERVREAVRSFRDNKLKDSKVECVYLTGGASRMDFVREIFQDVFGLDAEQCPPDDNPSTIVAEGVSALGYADYKTREKCDEIRREAKDIIDNFNWKGTLGSIVRAKVRKEIEKTADRVMSNWRDGLIGEYLELKRGFANGIDYGTPEQGLNGFHKVRNIKCLSEEISRTFRYMSQCDYGPQCSEIVRCSIIDQIVKRLKEKFETFRYNADAFELPLIDGLRSSITAEGAETLSRRFTGEGNDHIVYDCVKDRNIIMFKWNTFKDRWDYDRKIHYEYYNANYISIFSDSMWNTFFEHYIVIAGIDSVKKQVVDYVNSVIEKYISYARLEIFL